MTYTTTADNFNLATAFGSYAVAPLETLVKKELEQGQYLVRKIERGNGKKSTGAIVKALTPEFAIAALDSEIILRGYQEWLQELAGDCCKARIEAGATTLVESDYSLAEIEALLESKEVESGRVSKEKIAAWFATPSVSGTLAAAFREKLGASLTDQKLAQILASYNGVFQLLAKRELSLEESKRENLNKALALLPDSALKSYCTRKVAESGKKEADLFAL